MKSSDNNANGLKNGTSEISLTNCSNSSSMVNDTFDTSKYALIDLHLHLDGSMTAEDVVNMASMEGLSINASLTELKQQLCCPEECKNLNDYLNCFHLPNMVMQSYTTIVYSMESLVKRLDEQGLIYVEIRFAPQKHIRKGMTQEKVVQAAIEGLNKGVSESKNGIKANIILSCMRGEGNDDLNEETVSLADKYRGKGVCAIDLAGAEALYPTSKYRELFAYANQLGLPFTIHAGEAAGVESMKLAISYGAKRIGHGIRAHDDPDTKALLKAKNICLCCCPTSNLQTKAIPMKSLKDYPLQDFLKDEVAVCLNTDNMTVSNTTISEELKHLCEAGILSEDQAKTLVVNAIEHAFLSDNEKADLMKKALKRMEGQES